MATTIDEWMYQKAKHNNNLLLFKVGDFYEAHCKDAQVLGECCGLSVTTRKLNDGSMYAMAGFPYYALDNYMHKLTRAGHTVAIVEEYNNKTNNNNQNINNMNNETMNNAENQNVVATEKTIRTIKTGCLVYVDGKLQRMDPVRVEFDLDKLEAVEWYKIGGGEPQVVSHDMEFYASEEQFKAGHPMGDDAFIHRKVVDILSRCAHQIHEVNAKAWVYENGRAVEWDAAEHIHKVVLNDFKYEAVDVEFPVLYRYANAVYEWNNYLYKDDKGNEVEREGEYVPLIPDADQMPLVEKLKATIEECKKFGLRLMWDREDDNLGVINYRRVKEYGWANDLDIDEENGDRTIPLMFHRDCYLECDNMCCDDVLVIKKKEA